MNLKTSLCIALVLFGIPVCAAPASTQGINLNSSLQTEIINDPSLGGIKAFTVMMPSSWRFQGTVISPIICTLPSPVFRGYSPDGLTEIRLLPFFKWVVESGDKSHPQGLKGLDCIYLNGAMTAEQFLNRYVHTLDSTHVVGPMSIPTQYRKQLDELVAKMNASNSRAPKGVMHTTGDVAALRIETINGTFTIEQRLRARVVCTYVPKAIECIARLDVLRAPKGQLDALVALTDRHNLSNAKLDDTWVHAALEKMNKNRGCGFDPSNPDTAEIRIKECFDLSNPDTPAMRMVHRQAHDFGLLTLGEVERVFGGLDEPGDRPFRSMAEIFRPRDGTDWADFALDPEPDTLHTWSSSSGERYQTYDPGANPNGVLTGHWTEETKPVATKPQ